MKTYQVYAMRNGVIVTYGGPCTTKTQANLLKQSAEICVEGTTAFIKPLDKGKPKG